MALHILAVWSYKWQGLARVSCLSTVSLLVFLSLSQFVAVPNPNICWPCLWFHSLFFICPEQPVTTCSYLWSVKTFFFSTYLDGSAVLSTSNVHLDGWRRRIIRRLMLCKGQHFRHQNLQLLRWMTLMWHLRDPFYLLPTLAYHYCREQTHADVWSMISPPLQFR